MKRGNVAHWSDLNSCNSLLFFAELIVELLFDYSIPSNRISSLNSHYLCLDALETVDTIENAGVPEGTIKPIMEELISTLVKDCVFQISGEDPSRYYVKYHEGNYRRVGKASDLNYEESKKVIMTLNQRYFSNDWYFQKMTEYIIEKVLENKRENWEVIFRLTKSWLTELVNEPRNP